MCASTLSVSIMSFSNVFLFHYISTLNFLIFARHHHLYLVKLKPFGSWLFFISLNTILYLAETG